MMTSKQSFREVSKTQTANKEKEKGFADKSTPQMTTIPNIDEKSLLLATAAVGSLGVFYLASYLLKSNPKQIKVDKETINKKLDKKNILIIGGTAGIGKALAQSLIKRNANVTVVGRRNPELEKAKFVPLDLSLQKNAVTLPDLIDFSIFDIVVFSNGIIAGSKRIESDEKVEIDLAVSYLSRFAIVEKAMLTSSFASNRSDKSVKPRVFVFGYPGIFS